MPQTQSAAQVQAILRTVRALMVRLQVDRVLDLMDINTLRQVRGA